MTPNVTPLESVTSRPDSFGAFFKNKIALALKRMATQKKPRPLRCLLVVVTNDGQSSKGLAVEKAIPWSQVFMEHVDIDRVVTFAAILLVLYNFPDLLGKHQKQNRIVKFVLCLVGMAAFMFIRTSHNGFLLDNPCKRLLGIVSIPFKWFIPWRLPGLSYRTWPPTGFLLLIGFLEISREQYFGSFSTRRLLLV
jgi:hypothetical protein